MTATATAEKRHKELCEKLAKLEAEAAKVRREANAVWNTMVAIEREEKASRR
jgi:hypothetical protein